MPQKEKELWLPNADATEELDMREAPKAREGQTASETLPDVLLDVPKIGIDELELDLGSLNTKLSLELDLLKIIDLKLNAEELSIENVQLSLKGTSLQAFLKLNLASLVAAIRQALNTLEEHPEALKHVVKLLSNLARASSSVERQDADTQGSSRAEGEEGPGGDEARAQENSRIIKKKIVSDTGDVIEATLNEAGEVLEEEVVGKANNFVKAGKD